jgi:hypothetical protein
VVHKKLKPGNEHILWRVVLIALLVCLALATTSCVSRQPGPRAVPSLSAEQWREDLHYLATRLPRIHPNLFLNMTRTEFEHAVAELDEAIPSLSNEEVIVGFARIVAMAGDLHTALSLLQKQSGFFPGSPFRLYWFSDGLRIYKVATGLGALQQHVIGARVVRIGDTSIEDACARIAALISHENNSCLRVYTPHYLASPHILQALKIVPDTGPVYLDLVDSEGTPFRFRYTFTPIGKETDTASPHEGTELASMTPETAPSPVTEETDPASPPESWHDKDFRMGKGTKWITAAASCNVPEPLFWQRKNEDYWFTYLEDSETLYLRYAACVEIKRRFVRDLFACADTHPVERFVIDLRHNRGGVYPTLKRLIANLEQRPHLTRRGRLFVIVDHWSISGAAINAAVLREKLHALIVGEPTGGKPNTYGHARKLRLPNSRLSVECSTKYYEETQETGVTLVPDIPVEFTFDDYVNGRDPALEAVLQHTPEPDTDNQ